ncbi:MAG: hypothetical protein HN348_33045, partial [Proteobacteria bacterium]|nr:hypothetical protein [Pseudomonadota bacterium]
MQRDDGTLPLALTSLLLGVFGFIEVRGGLLENDIWWHLRTGVWIWENQQFPFTDPFGVGGESQTCLAANWPFDLLSYVGYSIDGVSLIPVFTGFMTIAIAALLHRLMLKSNGSFALATFFTFLGCYVLFWRMAWRPHLFTILF